MDQNHITKSYEHNPPSFFQKIKLYLSALIDVPFYRYGEMGNICYTIGKNILDGVILYTMFSMAEKELKVAAILGVMVKYAYPGITIFSSTYTSDFIDSVEAFQDIRMQISRLIKALVGIGVGQFSGAVFLCLCFHPVFKYFFNDVTFRSHLLVLFYLLHHICDGSAQIVEGRTWFKMIEIKLRHGNDQVLSRNFWVLYALSQNFQLILGQIFLWSALGMTMEFSAHLTAPLMMLLVSFGFLCVGSAKFILPATYKLKLCG